MSKKPEKAPTSVLPLHILLLDDNPFECEQLVKVLALGNEGALGCRFELESCTNTNDYLARLRRVPAPDVILLDVDLGPMGSGSEMIDPTRQAVPRTVIMMRSGLEQVEVITQCLKKGADDFLSKSSDIRELGLRIWNGYRLARLKRGEDMRSQSRTPAPLLSNENLVVGTTLKMISKRVPMLIKSAVSAIHISGESGTGKEKVADLFAASLPKGTPFVRVNCGAITPSLLDSELFGHIKGAFTGALAEKKGLIETASGGWIFLDEVATLSPLAQVALLRAIENHEIVRVGDNRPIQVSLHVLSATNEELDKLVENGRFRKDLWQRLCETKISLPPLRDRPDEIPLLVKFFCETMSGGPFEISEPALDVLSDCAWKNGNVRELRNCLRAMTEFQVNKILTPLSIPATVWEELDRKPTNSPVEPSLRERKGRPGHLQIPFDSNNPNFDLLTDHLLLELTKALSAELGKISLRQLAKLIGVSRSTLSLRFRNMPARSIVTVEEISNILGTS